MSIESLSSRDHEKSESSILLKLKEALSEDLDVFIRPDCVKSFLLEIQELRPTREDYEKMIEYLEPLTIDKVKILEEVKIKLRGDCLMREETTKKFHHNKTGAVRNHRYSLPTEEHIYAALGHLMVMICTRCNSAWHYERKVAASHLDSQSNPMIVFEADTFRDRKVKEVIDPKDFNDYFYGRTDDIGAFWYDPFTLELPSQGFDTLFPAPWKIKEVDSIHSEIVTLYDLSDFDRQRIERLFPYQQNSNDFGSEIILSRVESYFNALLITDTILKQISSTPNNNFDNEL